MEKKLGNNFRKTFTVQVVNVVEDFDGDGIEDAYDLDNDNDGFSNAEEIAYWVEPMGCQIDRQCLSHRSHSFES
jgi:hypothetical protein